MPEVSASPPAPFKPARSPIIPEQQLINELTAGTLNPNATFLYQSKGSRAEYPLICYAALFNYNKLVAALINTGQVDVNHTTTAAVLSKHKQSALMLACKNNNAEIVKLLLTQNINLLHQDAENNSALMHLGVHQLEICQHIIDKAAGQHIVRELMALKKPFRKLGYSTIFEQCVRQKNFDVFTYLSQQVPYDTVVDLPVFLHHISKNMLKYPHYFSELNALAEPIRKKALSQKKLLTLADADHVTVAECYEDLWGQALPTTPPRYEHHAAKIGLAEFQAALRNPNELLPVIAHISREFERYLQAKGIPLPQVDETSFTWIQIDHLSYPWPGENYQALPHDYELYLKEFFVLILNTPWETGATPNYTAHDWAGFAPPRDADPQMFNEEVAFDVLFAGGFAHGDVSHALQSLAVLLSGKLNTDFWKQWNVARPDLLALKRLQAYSIYIRTRGDNAAVWNYIRDVIVSDHLTFRHAEALFATCMQLPSTLRAVLINNSCNHFNYIIDIYQAARPELPAHIVKEYIRYALMGLFTPDFPANSILLTAARARDHIEPSSGNQHGYTTLHTYQPYTLFKIKPADVNTSNITPPLKDTPTRAQANEWLHQNCPALVRWLSQEKFRFDALTYYHDLRQLLHQLKTGESLTFPLWLALWVNSVGTLERYGNVRRLSTTADLSTMIAEVVLAKQNNVPLEINAPLPSGLTPLQHALLHDNKEMVAFLVGQKASIHPPAGEPGWEKIQTVSKLINDTMFDTRKQKLLWALQNSTPETEALLQKILQKATQKLSTGRAEQGVNTSLFSWENLKKTLSASRASDKPEAGLKGFVAPPKPS